MLDLRTVIFISALLKFLVLFFYIFLYGDSNFTYFQNDSTFHDDEKYFKTMIDYIKNADHVWDWEQLKSSSLLNGHNLDGGRDGLWFVIISIVGKLTNGTLFIQVLNVIFSLISLVYLFKLSKFLFNDRVAKISVLLLALNPYVIIFSIFPFKDNFVQLLFLVVFYKLVKAYKNNNIDVLSFFSVVLLILLIGQLRSGLDYIFVIIFFSVILKISKSLVLKIFIVTSIVLFVLFVFVRFSDKFDLIPRVLEILSVYIFQDRMDGLGSLFRIDSFDKIYLLPFTMLFTFSSPFMSNLPENISSWYDLATILNTFYIYFYFLGLVKLFEGLFIKYNSNRMISFSIFFIGAIISIISFGIFRHSFFFLPLILMYSAFGIVSYRLNNVFFCLALYLLLVCIYLIRIY